MELPTPPVPTSKRPESFEDAETRRCAYQNVSQTEMDVKNKPCETSGTSEGECRQKEESTVLPKRKSRALPKTITQKPNSAKLPEEPADADGEGKVLRWEMWRVITKSFRP